MSGITQKTLLPSGRVVELTYPPLYSILSNLGKLPSEHQVAVLDALREEGAYTPPQTMGDVEMQRRYWVANYRAAELCLSKPRLVLDREPGPGEWGERDLPAADAEAIRYNFFRYCHQGDPARVPGAADPGGPADAPPDRQGVRGQPGRAARGKRAPAGAPDQ